MGGQIAALVSQYIVIAGVLIALFLIMKKPEVLSNVINSISNLNSSAITAFKK
jgi:hypothetical protein